MDIRKAAEVTQAGTPAPAQLAAINTLAKSPLTAEEVYCFSVRLCDDQPDRDHERFDTAALPKLAELFRGKTGIVDHEWSAKGQVARIFDTEVCHEDGGSFIRAWCYMLRSESALIRQIEGGICKEVSVGCAMGQSRCSVCGSIYGTCEHRKGLTYGGQVCLAILSDPVDAYEFSFVAVPAQKQAGVLKGQKGGICMTLNELVTQHGTPDLCDALAVLEKEAAFGRESRKALEQEVVTLGLMLDFGADEGILRKSASALNCGELQQLKDAMRRKSLCPPQTQLPAGTTVPAAMDAAFLI